MSILIKGMEMPTNCEECPCSYWTEGVHHDYCQAVGYDTEIHYGEKGRPTWCPLIELPPHGRLIDADALHEELYALEYARENEWLDGVREARGVDAARVALLDAPTIIEAEEDET